MRLFDEMPIDPEIAAELEAIDLALAGEPVDPEHAELAELTVLLADDRGRPSDEFTRRLDAVAATRFATRTTTVEPSRVKRSPARSLFAGPGFRIALIAIVAIVPLIFVIANSPGGSSSSTTFSGAGSSAASAPAAGTSTTSSQHRVPGGSGSAAGAKQATSSSSSAGTPSASSAGSVSNSAVPVPNASGRKVVQSAQLILMASAGRIETVSGEVYNVVSQQNGIVERSHVTSFAGKGNQGFATFNLSIPTANLEAALGSLSALHYAHVVSRSDASQDVTGTYHNDQQRLQDAQALRTSLLKQLANASTQEQIDSLKAQLQDAEQQIASAQSTLKHIQRQTSYSTVSVQLESGSEPVPVNGSSGSAGFTIGHAVHDAGRVLVVAAGVLLIALAVMIPVALVAALVAWLVVWLRQRRREQALDRG